MTRFLSESLEAEEPYFRLGLLRLEAANGNPSTDIILSTNIMREAKAKILELGLDPNDTTEHELYEALKERLKSDDAKLMWRLRYLAANQVSAEGRPVDGMVKALKELPEAQRAYGLKFNRLKSLIKAQPPKKAMKLLHYRSLDSMLKHEHPVLILTAAARVESAAWHKHFLEQYKKLKTSDFEERQILLLQPSGRRWQNEALKFTEEAKHNLISFKELGVIIFLPLPDDVPAGSLTASLSLALSELNEIKAASTYLKLHSVRSDFGQSVMEVVAGNPELDSRLLDKAVPWNLVQRYYAKMIHNFSREIFEPYVQIEDMVWQPIEDSLAQIEPSFAFWKNTDCLGMTKNGKPLSFNVLDSALNLCNKLPFEHRINQYFQHALWHELLLGYLKHEPVEQSVINKLQPQLAMETVQA